MDSGGQVKIELNSSFEVSEDPLCLEYTADTWSTSRKSSEPSTIPGTVRVESRHRSNDDNLDFGNGGTLEEGVLCIGKNSYSMFIFL